MFITLTYTHGAKYTTTEITGVEAYFMILRVRGWTWALSERQRYIGGGGRGKGVKNYLSQVPKVI